MEQIYFRKFFINTEKIYKTEKLPSTELLILHNMGTPVKPTTRRTTRKILQAKEDSHAPDLQATYIQAIDLEASTNYKSKPHDPRMEVDGKMYHCSSCKQKFSKTNIATFCPQKNICRMCSHSHRVTDIEEQINSILHSRDQLEAINA